jgi:hypothetical protein
MKKILLVLLLMITITSCERYTYKDQIFKGVVTSKDSTEAYSKYEYHYGWSAWRGKFCWHWGNKHHSATYTTKVNVDGYEIEIGKNNYKVNDTIQVVKTLVFDPNKNLVDTRYSQK